MSFPASGGTREQLADALKEVRDIAGRIKRTSQGLHDRSAAGSVTARGIALYLTELADAQDRFDALKTVPGLAAYAQSQYNDGAFDIVAEFTAMQAAITNVTTWINDNMPKDSVSGTWLLLEEFVNFRLTSRLLTSGQTSGLRTQLLALIATID